MGLQFLFLPLILVLFSLHVGTPALCTFSVHLC